MSIIYFLTGSQDTDVSDGWDVQNAGSGVRCSHHSTATPPTNDEGEIIQI